MAEQTALTFTEKIAFLQKLEMFEELDDAELDALARITTQYEFSEGAVLVHQGDVADRLFMVESGRVEAVSINNEGVSRRETQFLPYDTFNDVWLFNPATHLSSIRARRDGRLLIIKSADFIKFLNNHPNVLNKLALTDEAIAELEKSPLARPGRRYKSIKLVAGELVELETKRSGWVLVAMLFLPVLGLITIPLLLFWLLPPTLPNLGMTWVLGIAGFFAFIFLIIVLFQWIDWANDYLIITNKRLVHVEFDLRSFSVKGKDTLMDRVQSVEIVTPNLLSTILNLGTARVTTAAQTVLYFDYLNNPSRVKEVINDIRERKQTMQKGDFKATMRQSLENYFAIDNPLHKLKEEPPPPLPERRTPLTALLKFFKSFRLYRYRIEEGSTITYRKHIFALLVEVVWPLGIALLLGVLLLGLRWLELDGYAGFVFIAGLIDMLWIIWRTEDWRNDTFQVTDRYVIDIDRRPFGFGESRKQAQLDNIQDIEADRPNFLATLFNFGKVEVETAGADSNIIFENISDPERIKNDIFKKRTKFLEQKQKGQAEAQRREYAVLLDVFLQEQEMDRVGRRTPDFDNALDALAETLSEQQQNE